MSDNFVNRLFSVDIRFLVHFLEIIEKFLFYTFMCFNFGALFIIDIRDLIAHSSLDCSFVKKLRILLTLFQPSDSRFLPPENFLL